MHMTFRWYGKDDPVTLNHIRQIPGMDGIVSAIYSVAVGELWPIEDLKALRDEVAAHGLTLSVVESIPVHEDIKLGLPSRDDYIANFKENIRRVASVGVKTVCYNFMPVFDWTRSALDHELADGSNALVYYSDQVAQMDPLDGSLALPGWDSSYQKEELKALIDQYKALGEEKLWDNLKYFLEHIIPVAEEVGVNMAIHPDDPPWPIFGLPRIITCFDNMKRFVELVDSPRNGLTVCTGSLGVSTGNDLTKILDYFLARGRIHFIHMRNVKITGDKSFEEAAHPSKYGSLDMAAIVAKAVEHNYTGPVRPDHGRMIWGETGKPGYGLYDRALGATYLYGLYEASLKCKRGN